MGNADLDNTRRSISATLAEIEQLQRALGLGPDPDDREAYDIVCRIERKVLANMPDQQAAE